MADYLDSSAVEAIAELAERAANGEREIQEKQYGKYKFIDKQLHRVNVDPKQPEAVNFFTLDGLVRFLHAGGTVEKEVYVHVVSPQKVSVYGGLIGEDSHLRTLYATATCPKSAVSFQFNRYGPLSDINVALLTQFVPEVGDWTELREFLAAVRNTEEVGLADDGVSQTVTAKANTVAAVATPVRPIWNLALYRSFAEIEQPTSPYVLRFQSSAMTPIGALFETGDARWMVTAVNDIAAWLRGQLGDGWNVLG